MREILALYWRAMKGFRLRAAWAVGFMSSAGFLEGLALLMLVPILSQGVGSPQHDPSPRYVHFYDMLGIPRAHRLTYAFLMFIATGIFSAFFRLVAEMSAAKLRTRIEEYFRKRLGDALLTMDWPYYLKLRQGQLGKAMML